jgi:hypothetical protein
MTSRLHIIVGRREDSHSGNWLIGESETGVDSGGREVQPMKEIGFNVAATFVNHQPTPTQTQRYERVLAAGKLFAESLITEVGGNGPPSPGLTGQLEGVHTTCLWAQDQIIAAGHYTAGGAGGASSG